VSIEYYPSQVGPSFYKVTKFLDAAEPDNVYFVTMVRRGDKRFDKGHTDPQMHCDCPNRRRGKHINDKHGVMISKWLLASKPQGYFDEHGEWHGTGHLAENPFDTAEEAGDPGAEVDEADDQHGQV